MFNDPMMSGGMGMVPGSPGGFQMPPNLGMAAMGLQDPLGMAGEARGMQPQLNPLADLLLTLLLKGGRLPYQQAGGDPMMQALAGMGGMMQAPPMAPGAGMPPPAGMMGGGYPGM